MVVVLINSFMKRIILILGLVFSMVAVDAKPQKGPKGKGKALKERFEAAKKKRDAKRGDAKKKGHKHKGPRGEFGKLVRNDEKIKEMVQYDGPVIFDCRVDPNENCFPMIPSGKPHNQMILGPSEKEENKITGKGKALV